MPLRQTRRGRALVVVVFLLALALTPLNGVALEESLPELVRYLTKEHNLVRAAEADVTAARERARVALGDWFPSLDLSLGYGLEKQNKPTASPDTSLTTRDADIKITQLLWDFGKTDATTRRAGHLFEQALANRDIVQQDTLLRGLTAYLNVIRRAQVLSFQKQSETNIKQQTELENALVQAGRGFSTDVLQAKARLAGAESRRFLAEGEFEVARNQYRAIFEREPPPDPESWTKLRLPIASIPDDLAAIVRIAFDTNPNLKSAYLGSRIAEEDLNSTLSQSFFPRVQGVVEQRYKKEFAGTVGFQEETLGKLELTFPFNLGFTAMNTLRASEQDRSATAFRVTDTKDLAEQRARDAWFNLQTAQSNTKSLKNQVIIVSRFLENAREERRTGRRSLLDVLDGETQLLGAKSDAASAEADKAIAVFELLAAMGQLTADRVESIETGVSLKPKDIVAAVARFAKDLAASETVEPPSANVVRKAPEIPFSQEASLPPPVPPELKVASKQSSPIAEGLTAAGNDWFGKAADKGRIRFSVPRRPFQTRDPLALPYLEVATDTAAEPAEDTARLDKILPSAPVPVSEPAVAEPPSQPLWQSEPAIVDVAGARPTPPTPDERPYPQQAAEPESSPEEKSPAKIDKTAHIDTVSERSEFKKALRYEPEREASNPDSVVALLDKWLGKVSDALRAGDVDDGVRACPRRRDAACRIPDH